MIKNIPQILINGLFNLDYDSFTELIYNHKNYINYTNEKGETLLHFACYYGLVDKFIILSNMGAIAKKTSNNDTLLHYASLGGKDYYLFHSLIKDERYNLLESNKNGLTPFHLCSNLAMSSMAYRYLEMKELNFKLSSIIDNNGNNPAHISAQNSHQDVLDFYIQEDPTIISSVNLKGETPLNIEKQPYIICKTF